MVKQAVMTQLVTRLLHGCFPSANPERRRRAWQAVFKQLDDAGQNAASSRRQRGLQVHEVGRQKFLCVFRGVFDPVMSEQIAGDGPISPSGGGDSARWDAHPNSDARAASMATYPAPPELINVPSMSNRQTCIGEL